MKIAIPVSEDKHTIFQRTGHAPYFAIYEDHNLVHYIENSHEKGGHGAHEHHEHDHDHHEHVAGHKKDIAALEGCEYILVQMIGEHMREAVESLGMKVKKIRKKDGDNANEVVEKFLNNTLYKGE